MNIELSYDFKEKEILIEVAKVNAYYNVVSSSPRGELDFSYLKQQLFSSFFI